MRNHHVAQAVMNRVMEEGLFQDLDTHAELCNAKYITKTAPVGSSRFMCHAIKNASKAGLVSSEDAAEAIQCIGEYMLEVMNGQDEYAAQAADTASGSTMRAALAARGINMYDVPKYRTELYRNWLERPRYLEAP